ncbi:MAG: FtsX-like permease family protein [Acidimicrobiales bacterium]
MVGTATPQRTVAERPASSSARPAPRVVPPRALRIKTRRDVRRQLPQFVAVAVTVLLGVALFVASFDAFRNLEASYDTTYTRLHFADLTVTGGDVARFAGEAAGVDGVAATATRTQADLPMQVGTAKPYGRVIGLPPAGQPPVDQVDVVAGTYLDPGRPDGVLLERHAADHFGLGPGATVEVVGADGPRTLTVVGVADSPEYLWPARSRQDILTDPDSFAVVFAPEATARALAGVTGPNQALVELTPAGRAGDALDRLEARARAAGAADVQPRAEQPSNAALHEDINGFAEMSVAFPLLFLTAAAIAAYVLLTRRVLSERPVIGMLRAAGARRGPVVVHYLGHGVLAGLLGAVPGVVVGVVATTWVTRAYTSAVDVPDTVVARHPPARWPASPSACSWGSWAPGRRRWPRRASRPPRRCGGSPPPAAGAPGAGAGR